MIFLAVDLDGTLLGDEKATGALLEKFNKLRDRGTGKLVYATGHSLAQYKILREQESLGNPDAVICSVGTELYVGEDLRPDTDMQTQFSQGWDLQKIKNLCLKSANLRPQPEIEQSAYKLCFYGNKGENYADLRAALEADFPAAKLLISHGGEFVDVLPKHSNKGRAVEYAAERFNISQSDIYCAGDSANDIEMLENNRAIIVGNAHDELMAWCAAYKGGNVYCAKNKYAAGIDEGLGYFLGQNWGEP